LWQRPKSSSSASPSWSSDRKLQILALASHEAQHSVGVAQHRQRAARPAGQAAQQLVAAARTAALASMLGPRSFPQI
jgi:hypothetical protein